MRRKSKGILSFILILSMLIGLAPIMERTAAAAPENNIGVVSYRYNQSSGRYELVITWNGQKSAKTLKIEYRTPENPSVPVVKEDIAVQEVESLSSSVSKFNAVIDAGDFKDDYVYGLDIKILDNLKKETGSGFLYFTPKITFGSSRVEQELEPGVHETGTKPELKLSWKVPKIWYGGSFVDISSTGVFDEMKGRLGLAEDITSLDYRINISTKAQALDSGADLAPVMVTKDTDGYKASSLGKSTGVAEASGTLHFNLRGRKDLKDTSLDSNDDVKDPAKSILAHEQVLPGTVYFMNIKPVFTTSAGIQNIVTVGDPSKYNGSMVTDQESNLAYTYTPVRFALSRDASDNIYAKVYRINKDDGSLDMPNLYYSIQAIDTPGVPYGTDWPEKAKMTDEFFPKGSEYAVTVIAGVNPGTSMYYKVVVKTDSKKDRIESLKLKYQMDLDTTKPPIPIDVRPDNSKAQWNQGTVVDPETGSEMLDQNGNPVTVKSTDVLITWQKPKSWDLMTEAQKNELNFNILINTNPVNLDMKYPLKVNEKEKEYLLNYRWVKRINGGSSELRVSDDGQRLEYVLKGRELFKIAENSYIKNPDKYPMHLLENMVYYIKIFTTKGELDADKVVDIEPNGVLDEKDIRAVLDPENVSDMSVTASFTTLPRVEKEVPVPTGFKAVSEDIDASTKKNYAVLQFDKINVDWTNYTSKTGNNEYYDLFMSTSGAADAVYTQIGSTDASWLPENLLVDKVEFNLVNGKWLAVVSGLRANSTYYFKLRTRLDFSDAALDDRSSGFTAVVPVTTRRSDVKEPDDSERKPLAPVDFKIALDADGKPELTGSGVNFDWSREENGVTYKLIATTRRISEYAKEQEYINDPYYQSFTAKFGDSVLKLDPDYPNAADGFSYDGITETCKYRVQDWLVPNNLYYFSIRAERKVTVKDENGEDVIVTISSAWVTLPVTTSLIDAPQMLETVTDIQLGVNWTDSDMAAKAEDYKIYIREASASSYRPLEISEATITKDDEVKNGLSTFYGRIRGLKAKTRYDVVVYKGQTGSSSIYKELGSFTTRDDYHQVEVRWKGLPGYDYEVAVRAEGDNDYVILNSSDFELTREEGTQTQGTEYYMYYARIKTIPVKISDFSTITVPLRSNMKYYIKVRSAKSGIPPSGYIGPAMARTQFNQEDYDDKEDIEDQKAKFLDKLEELEEKLYWRMDIGNASLNKILLKGDRVVNTLQNRNYPLTIDISEVAGNYRRDVVYIPAVVIHCLARDNKVLSIKTKAAEYFFRPDTVDMENMEEIRDIRKQGQVKDVFLKLTISRTEYGVENLSAEVKRISEVNELGIAAIGSSRTDAQLKEDFHNKVYNAETGLVKQKVDAIKYLYNIGAGAVFAEGDHYARELVNQVELELSRYIGNTVEGGNGISSMAVVSKELKEFTSPMQVALVHSDSSAGIKLPYVVYNGTYDWQKLSAGVLSEANEVRFGLLKPGKVLLAVQGSFATDVPQDHWALEYINTFASKYDMSDIFGNTASFSPESSVSVREVILLYEKVAGKTHENAGLDIKQKSKRLGLDGLVNASAAAKDVTRQEAASVLVRLYCVKEGLNQESLVPRGNIYILDERAIADKHYKGVAMAVDLGLFSLDGEGEFKPASYITRAQAVTAAVRLLRLTGEL